MKRLCVLCVLGELFWSVDPVSRSVGQPQSITDTLGVSSPIDTVFTRCNCHGNTYIIKVQQLLQPVFTAAVTCCPHFMPAQCLKWILYYELNPPTGSAGITVTTDTATAAALYC